MVRRRWRDEGIAMGMIIGGNGRDEWNGQPAVGTMSMKRDKMGIKVENGAGSSWPCAWGFMHVNEK